MIRPEVYVLFSDLFASDRPTVAARERRRLAKAYVVIAVDVASGNRLLLHGNPRRERKLIDRRPVEVVFDSQEHDLGRLVELLEGFNGRCKVRAVA